MGQIFKSGPNKICERQRLKKLKGYLFKFLKGCLPQILLGPLLNIWTYMKMTYIPQNHLLTYRNLYIHYAYKTCCGYLKNW